MHVKINTKLNISTYKHLFQLQNLHIAHDNHIALTHIMPRSASTGLHFFATDNQDYQPSAQWLQSEKNAMSAL